MGSERASDAESPLEETSSRTQEWVQLAILSGLTVLTALFGLMALTLVAEALGPSETRTGRTLERSSFEWQSSICNFGRNRTPGRACIDFETPAGAVTGEFPDGDSWIVVADETGTSPSDVAGRPGTEVQVTSSTITGRVIALDNGRRFESVWKRSNSFEFYVVTAFGLVLIAALAAILGVRRRTGQSFQLLPRSVVVGSFALALALGAFGMWWGLIRSLEQYRAPSSSDLYGALVSDPYQFAVTAEQAEEAGRSVELPGEGVVVRALQDTELVQDLRDAIGGEGRPTLVVVTDRARSGNRLFALRALVETPAGDVIEGEPCLDFDFPAEIGVDPSVAAGTFCFPVGTEAVEVRLATTIGATGAPIVAPLIG